MFSSKKHIPPREGPPAPPHSLPASFLLGGLSQCHPQRLGLLPERGSPSKHSTLGAYGAPATAHSFEADAE